MKRPSGKKHIREKIERARNGPREDRCHCGRPANHSGVHIGYTKLTPIQCAAIHLDPRGMAQVARDHGVHRYTVRRIRQLGIGAQKTETA